MLPCVCSVIDHRGRENVVRTSVTHSCATFLFLPHFDVICDLLLNRRTATWNLFVNPIMHAPSLKSFLKINFSFIKDNKTTMSDKNVETFCPFGVLKAHFPPQLYHTTPSPRNDVGFHVSRTCLFPVQQ